MACSGHRPPWVDLRAEAERHLAVVDAAPLLAEQDEDEDEDEPCACGGAYDLVGEEWVRVHTTDCEG